MDVLVPATNIPLEAVTLVAVALVEFNQPLVGVQFAPEHP